MLTWLCSIIWIYQQLDNSRNIRFVFLDTPWCIPAIHFFEFSTSKWYSTVVQHTKLNMKQPKASGIHGLENMEQCTFLHKRNQFSDMDRCTTGFFFWNFWLYSCIVFTGSTTTLSIIPINYLFFLLITSWTLRYQQEHNLIQICIYVVNSSWFFFRNIMIVGHFFILNSPLD